MEGIWKKLIKIGKSVGITIDVNLRQDFKEGDEVFVDFKEFRKGGKKKVKGEKVKQLNEKH